MVGSGRVGRVGWTSPSAPQLQHPVLAVQLQGPIDAIVTDDPQHGLTASYAFNDPERFQLGTYKGRLVQGKDPADQRAIQRQRKRGNPGRRAVYTWPSKKALAAVKAKVCALTRAGSNQPLAALLGHLNRILRGWTAYFRYGVSKRTFDYLGQFTWNRVLRWLRRKHLKASWGWLRRRYLPRWWPTHGTTELLRCGHVTVRRYRYRGAQIPTPWRRPGDPHRTPARPTCCRG